MSEQTDFGVESAPLSKEVSKVDFEDFTSGDEELVQMSISMEQMQSVIDRLTDLYPNPVAAAVREPISNAVDACNASDSLPDGLGVEVTLPTKDSPNLVVKDYGVGMTLEEVKTLLSKYGGSTKTGDGSQIGAYGLGFKAPLAYTTKFTVATTKNGVTSVVEVARTNRGNVMKILSSVEYGGGSGTEVTIPFQEADFDEVRRLVHNYQLYMVDVPLTVDGEAANPLKDYVEWSPIRLDRIDGGETLCKTWLHKDFLKKFFLNIGESPLSSENLLGQTRLVLSGWPYAVPNSGAIFVRSSSNPSILVELKPYLVDFSSSRDEVTANALADGVKQKILEKFFIVNEHAVNRRLKEAASLVKRYPKDEALRSINLLPVSYLPSYREFSVPMKRNSSSQSEELFIQEDAFEDANHGNLLTWLLFTPPKDKCFGAVTIPDANEKFLYAYHTPNPPSIERGLAYHRSGVKNTTDAVLKSFDDGETYSIAGTVSAMERAREMKSTSFYGSFIPSKYAVVEEVDATFVRQITRSRKVFAEKIFKEEVNVVLAPSSLTAECKDFLGLLLGDNVSYYKAEELSKEAKELTKKANVVKKKTPLAINAQKIPGVEKQKSSKDILKVLSGALMPYSLNNKVLVSDMVKDDATIIICSRRWPDARGEAAFVGAVNQGYSPLNKPLYIVQDRDARAVHLEELKTYPNLFISEKAKHSSKIFQELVKTRVRNGERLEEDLNSLTKAQVVKLFFNESASPTGEDLCSNLDEEVLKKLVSDLGVNSIEAHIFEDLLISKHDQLRDYYGLGMKLSKSRLSADERDATMWIAKVFHIPQPSYSSRVVTRTLDEVAFSTLLRKNDSRGYNRSDIFKKEGYAFEGVYSAFLNYLKSRPSVEEIEPPF